MTVLKNKQESPVRDYRERFEFRLTVGNYIICQRYFRIHNFNPKALQSYELADTIRNCATVIDRDLKSKTQAYLEIFAPQHFDSVEQMNEFFSKSENVERMRYGLGIVVDGSDVDYVWGKDNKPVPFENHTPNGVETKFDDGSLFTPITDDDRVTYKFAFCVDGRETCSAVWEGVYPKYIRNSIDLANKKGKRDGEDVSHLNFEQYLDYKIVEGRSDLVYNLIKDIVNTCSVSDNSYYTCSDTYGKTKYSNNPWDYYALWGVTNNESKTFNKKRN